MDKDTNGDVTMKTEDGGYCNPTVSLELEENVIEQGQKPEMKNGESLHSILKPRTKFCDSQSCLKRPLLGKACMALKPGGSLIQEKDEKTDLPGVEEKKTNLTIIVEDEDGFSAGEDPEGREEPLLYKVGDSPPISLTLFFGFQQTLLSIVGSLIVPFLVADAVCAQGDNVVVTRLLSTTMMLNGITSLFQTVLGVRLPLFQGPSASYIVPLQSMNIINPSRCELPYVFPDNYMNGTLINGTSESDLQSELINLRLQELIGPLVICGSLHALVGLTGLAGFLMRFVGPITIIPTLVLIGIYIVKPSLPYVESHWGVALFTWATSVVLSLYLGGKKMPIPWYSKAKGFTVIRYPLHQVFALLISIILGWTLCGILTLSGALTDDPDHIGYKARTDARDSIMTDSPWFYFPYPGQFGAPKFAISAFIGFLIATVTSILDSIGDYYACAGMCRVPPPPGHAINRGLAVEGFCTILSGFMGAGHATTTYGSNIGAIGMTKVASRRVFVVMSIFYIAFGLFSKFSAVFVSIPYPVLGGTIMTVVGVFVGLNLSHLQVVDLSSTRNLSIMGMGIFIGYFVPSWVEKNPNAVYTGNEELDEAFKVILGNPNFVGTVLSCFLDNTIPGTPEERGIAAWRENTNEEENLDTEKGDNSDKPQVEYLEGAEVYDPIIPECLKSTWLMKYLPIFPFKSDSKQPKYDLDRRQSIFVDLSTLDEGRRRSSVLGRRMSSVLEARRMSNLLEIRRGSAANGVRRKSVLSTF